MKNKLKISIALLIFVFSNVFAQGITFTFEDETLTTDGPDRFLEFDIYVEATASSDIGDCQAYVIYNTDAFGTDINDSGGLTVTKGSLVDDSTGGGTQYYLLQVNDNGANPDRYSIAIQYNAYTPATLSTDTMQWAHVKMKILDIGESAGLSFWSSEMDGIQYMIGPTEYDPVVSSDLYDESLPVQMAGMSAVAIAGEGITVLWETQSEVNCLGFHVWRSEESSSGYAKITSDLISSQGNGSALTEYAYTDKHVAPNTIYWYKIEEISLSGASTFYGPISVQGVSALPTSYALSQNYPNPFNPETAFSFDAPQDGRVTIRVYSLLGQEVMTLIDESIHAGRYDMSWNGKNNKGLSMPSGIYFLKMIAGSFQQVRKVTLIR
jgi:hypothetical protein